MLYCQIIITNGPSFLFQIILWEHWNVIANLQSHKTRYNLVKTKLSKHFFQSRNWRKLQFRWKEEPSVWRLEASQEWRRRLTAEVDPERWQASEAKDRQRSVRPQLKGLLIGDIACQIRYSTLAAVVVKSAFYLKEVNFIYKCKQHFLFPNSNTISINCTAEQIGVRILQKDSGVT
jgi:hypothetical protein